MTQPVPPTRLVILEDRRGSSDDVAGPRMRRYRIARLRFEDLPALANRRFEYLKRGHD
jgi:hypothetical protein